MHPPASAQVENEKGIAPATKLCSIASVTVAYNGVSALRQHLKSLKRQSRSLDEIVVVDNASTDDTLRMLANEFPEVTVLPLPENNGVGGGLAAGLAYVISQKKYDWVWTFDQDSLPSANALERLLDGLEFLNGSSERTAILAPICANTATGLRYPALTRLRSGGFLPASHSADQRITFVDMVISSGSLMRCSAVAEVGLPRSDFFIDFVDYEHCLRLRHRGFRIAVVHESLLDHAVGSPKKFRFFGCAKSWANHAPWREYYMTRNEIFTMWMYSPTRLTKWFVLYRLARHSLAILFFGSRKRECFRMIWRGFVDGRTGRLGRRFWPGDTGNVGSQTATSGSVAERKLP